MRSSDYENEFDAALDDELELQALADDTDNRLHSTHATRNQAQKDNMPTDFEDDDFDLDEDDELELQALADSTDKRERKHARNESGAIDGPPTKVLKISDEPVNSVALDVAVDVLKKRFKLPGFRLKQSLAISRLLSGGSSVVVFPTGKIDLLQLSGYTITNSH